MKQTRKQKEFDTLIFCAGKGTRMYPYSLTIPKPLLPLNDGSSPLFHICEGLAGIGVTSAVVNYSYGAEYFKKAVEEIGNELGLEIHLSYEAEPLGHAGGLRNALSGFSSDKVFALNGDTIISLSKEMSMSLSSACTEDVPLSILGIRHGDSDPLHVTGDGYLTGVRDRFFSSDESSDLCDCAGAYTVHRTVIEDVPEGEFMGFFAIDDLVERIIKSGKKCVVIGTEENVERVAIGTCEEYEYALENGIIRN